MPELDTKCPRCGREMKDLNNGLFRCGHCLFIGDGFPDEGGSYVSSNPERSAISREEYELRQKARRESKRKRAIGWGGR